MPMALTGVGAEDDSGIYLEICSTLVNMDVDVVSEQGGQLLTLSLDGGNLQVPRKLLEIQVSRASADVAINALYSEAVELVSGRQ